VKNIGGMRMPDEPEFLRIVLAGLLTLVAHTVLKAGR
jgi:hypothetical protein